MSIFPNLNISFNGEYAPAKELYDLLGLKYNSMDANGEYNSLVVDFNEDIQSKYKFTEKFDLCTNMGTSEHLIGQVNFFKNIHNTTKVNGMMLHLLPMEGYHGHCYFNYDVESEKRFVKDCVISYTKMCSFRIIQVLRFKKRNKM